MYRILRHDAKADVHSVEVALQQRSRSAGHAAQDASGLRAFSSEVDPVHRRKCVENKGESRFHVSGNGSSSAAAP
jgi:hypothetical protein